MGKELIMRKDWIARELTVEVVVGVFLVMVLLGLGYFTIFLSNKKFGKDKYEFEAIFNDVMGLRVTDDVVVRGMPIGKVKDLHLEEDGVHVVCYVDKKMRLKKDYRITIVSKSLLGGRSMQIYEGSDALPELPAGLDVYGVEPYDLISDAAELVGAIKNGFTEGGIIENLKTTSEQIKDITTRLNAGEGTFGKLMSKDDTVYKDLASTAASLQNIADRIDRGEGMIGKLLSDDNTLYKDIELIVKEARATIDDFRETQPVVTFSSLFFGGL